MGAKVIAIANQKGGVGKTTTTLSLGAALSRKGLRVLIIDLDPHACASVHLRFYPEELDATVHDLFMAEPAAYGELWKRIVRRNEGQDWDVVAASIRLSELEVDLKNRKGKGAILQDAVSLVRDRYDYILLDCPPHVGILLVNALVVAPKARNISTLRLEGHRIAGPGGNNDLIRLYPRAVLQRDTFRVDSRRLGRDDPAVREQPILGNESAI